MLHDRDAALHIVLGRLMVDAAFDEHFHVDPTAAVAELGVNLGVEDVERVRNLAARLRAAPLEVQARIEQALRVGDRMIQQ